MKVPCSKCASRAACGGLDEFQVLVNCHPHSAEVCRARGWTCLVCDPVRYVQRMGAAKLRASEILPVRSPDTTLPAYLGLIQHADNWSGAMPFPIVALSTRAVLGGRGARYGVRFKSRESLLAHFGLRADVGILLVSVAQDRHLERYWRWGKANGIPEQLAALGVTGITVPNYSFFTDAPKYEHAYNLLRHHATAYEFANAGISVVPHLQALTEGDLRNWREWLRAHPHVRHICREFQCGNRGGQVDELARLQDDIGRELHPIIVGGGRYAQRVFRRFRRATLVDSTPFFKAMNRFRYVDLGSRLDEVKQPFADRGEIGAMLRHNLATYGAFFTRPLAEHLEIADLLEHAVYAADAVRQQKQSGLWMPATVGTPPVRAPQADGPQLSFKFDVVPRLIHLPVVGSSLADLTASYALE